MQYDIEKKVYRSFAIPMKTFDYLKSFQRGYENHHQETITNNEALVIILAQHQWQSERKK